MIFEGRVPSFFAIFSLCFSTKWSRYVFFSFSIYLFTYLYYKNGMYLTQFEIKKGAREAKQGKGTMGTFFWCFYLCIFLLGYVFLDTERVQLLLAPKLFLGLALLFLIPKAVGALLLSFLVV